MPDPKIRSRGIRRAAALQAEVESLKDQRLRALAEAEKYPPPRRKEKADASQYAVTKFARDMLGIADNFARALAACPPMCARRRSPGQGRAGRRGSHRPPAAARPGALWREGGRHQRRQVRSQPASGDRGSARQWQARRRIVDVVQIRLHDRRRLLRPAMVTVAKKDVPPKRRRGY
jgi:molecular chaperone GrpE